MESLMIIVPALMLITAVFINQENVPESEKKTFFLRDDEIKVIEKFNHYLGRYEALDFARSCTAFNRSSHDLYGKAITYIEYRI